MARVSDGTNVPVSLAEASASNMGSLNGSGSDLDGMGTRSGRTTDGKLDALRSNFVHFETQIAKIPALTNGMSRMDSHITKTLGDFATGLSEMEKSFNTLTARMCMVETEAASASNVSGSGFQVIRMRAPQPYGPMTKDHLMTTETQDEDFTHSPDPKMNNPVVPSYDDSLANSTTKGLQSGSIPFGKNPICWRITHLSEFIVKQLPCQSVFFLKHEANVGTLLIASRMIVSVVQ